MKIRHLILLLVATATFGQWSEQKSNTSASLRGLNKGESTSRGMHFAHSTGANLLESKAEGLNGPARIGRVTFSKTEGTLYYRGKSFRSLKGAGFKANYYEVETREQYWISGPRRDGKDRLYISNIPVEIDEDVREEYWTKIRKQPARKGTRHA